jgi:hypothetical protein
VIRNYILQFNQARGDIIMEENDPTESMKSLSHGTAIQFEEVDKLLMKLKFF